MSSFFARGRTTSLLTSTLLLLFHCQTLHSVQYTDCSSCVLKRPFDMWWHVLGVTEDGHTRTLWPKLAELLPWKRSSIEVSVSSNFIAAFNHSQKLYIGMFNSPELFWRNSWRLIGLKCWSSGLGHVMNCLWVNVGFNMKNYKKKKYIYIRRAVLKPVYSRLVSMVVTLREWAHKSLQEEEERPDSFLERFRGPELRIAHSRISSNHPDPQDASVKTKWDSELDISDFPCLLSYTQETAVCQYIIMLVIKLAV